MIIVRVKFHDWNGYDRVVNVTSENLESLLKCKTREGIMVLASKYIKRRYTECMHIISCEIIEKE